VSTLYAWGTDLQGFLVVLLQVRENEGEGNRGGKNRREEGTMPVLGLRSDGGGGGRVSVGGK